MWCLTIGQASAEQIGPDGISRTLSETKIFTLQHKDVVAIAVDANVAAERVADPLGYQLEVYYSQALKGNTLEIVVNYVDSGIALTEKDATKEKKAVNGSFLKQVQIDKSNASTVRITALFADNVKPQVAKVKRKRVIRQDGSIDLRTYLVLNFSGDAVAKTIVLDAGHGGHDSGAVNNFLCEKDLNLDIALRARDIFRQEGYDVYMTRMDDTDIPLLDRADAANILNAAAFISVHNNSMPDDMPEPAKKLYRGTTVLYNGTALKTGKELAAIMCDELVDRLRTHKYPLQDRPNLVVLNSTWVPAVIAEVSMMPNSQDAKMISQPVYRQRAAEAIAESTNKFLQNAVLASRTTNGG